MDALACLLLSCASALLGFWLALDSDDDELSAISYQPSAGEEDPGAFSG